MQIEEAVTCPGPKSFWDFRGTNPRELKSKLAAPCSFYMVFSRNTQILYCSNWNNNPTIV